MIFILGVITGLIISILLFFIEGYLAPAERPIVRLSSYLQQKKGDIIQPDTAQDELFKKNDSEGIDTYLEDI